MPPRSTRGCGWARGWMCTTTSAAGVPTCVATRVRRLLDPHTDEAHEEGDAEDVDEQGEDRADDVGHPFAARSRDGARERRGERVGGFVERAVQGALVGGGFRGRRRGGAAGQLVLLMGGGGAGLVDDEDDERGDHDQADNTARQQQQAGERGGWARGGHGARLDPDMDAPAEHTSDPQKARGRLVELLREHALLIGEVTLTSGRVAQYYVDVKRAILLPEAFMALGVLVAERARACGASAGGGG